MSNTVCGAHVTYITNHYCLKNDHKIKEQTLILKKCLNVLKQGEEFCKQGHIKEKVLKYKSLDCPQCIARLALKK
ncbi:unnamed protein product [Cunninghamella blakesleeana]